MSVIASEITESNRTIRIAYPNYTLPSQLYGYRRPTVFFSSMQREEHELIVWLIEKSEELLRALGKRINLKTRILFRMGSEGIDIMQNRCNKGFQQAFDILNEHIHLIDLEDKYKSDTTKYSQAYLTCAPTMPYPKNGITWSMTQQELRAWKSRFE